MPKARRRARHHSAKFEDMALPQEALDVLARQGLTHAFEIQEAILPDALAGRDVLARAETGSGKTLAFTLAMCARFRGRSSHRHRPLGVVLVPTRELASQVVDTIHPFARACGIKAQLVAGGMNLDKQAEALRAGCEIIVATPGRLVDLAERNALMLDRVETTVIDEADHMTELGFFPVLVEILQHIPMGTQKMLFSATLDDAADELVDRFLVDPITHEMVPVAAAVQTMRHYAFAIDPKRKRQVTAQIAARSGRTLLFTRTQLGAERVAQELCEVGIAAAALHGSKQQGLRTNVLAGFRQGGHDGGYDVLVATDVAARGLHIDDVSLVLHVDPATDIKEYVHRSGRTARAGAQGMVATLVLPHQVEPMRKVLAGAKVEPEWVDEVTEQHESLSEVGARTPSGQPVDDPALTKYKGAPRKLDLSRKKGANARIADERRMNEQLRAAWDEQAADQPKTSRSGRGGGQSATRGGARTSARGASGRTRNQGNAAQHKGGACSVKDMPGPPGADLADRREAPAATWDGVKDER
ncbi:DEAD/DEAH box helicase [Devriesea agamarum]|uniref:DEAD/DEAH box helicase n=1 Tax=Devriesea agamarum TaxID=472569 RepID=UPI000A7DB380|nr:DEAD/DEAH box helicase [Devriesea agamarum]